jgi:hypothetical protein
MGRKTPFSGLFMRSSNAFINKPRMNDAPTARISAAFFFDNFSNTRSTDRPAASFWNLLRMVVAV